VRLNNRVRFGRFLIALAIATAAPARILAQQDDASAADSGPAAEENEGAAEPAEEEDGKKAGATTDEKKGEWLLAPIPVHSPAIGSGLEWAIARVFPFDKKDEVSPASSVGVGGIFTNNGSRGVAIGGKLYLKQDRYRVTAAVASASINFDLYGIGAASGREGVFVPLNVDGRLALGEFLYRLRKSIYVGARGQYRNATLGLNQDRLDSSDITAEPPDQFAGVVDQIREQFLHQTTVSLGPRFQWDTRDNVFYPKRGFLTEVASDFFSTGLGSKWSYQYYRASFNKYTAISANQVIAFRGMGCAAAGDHVPIYDLCLFGAMNDLRGYTAGRYQDRRMFATQAEYRLMLPVQGFLGRFGVVAFGGVGAVGDKFTNIGSEDLLPAGGAGVRFRLLKKYPINFRVDYGFGKDGHTLGIGVMEAF
jgi:outer membrane protein assembly factor BamA